MREELVAFLDLTATSLALGAVKIPRELEGQVFLGPLAGTKRKYVYAHRDYMDEVFDRIRSVRDERFRYIRNFHPELPYAQRIEYMEMSKTMQVWRQWHSEGKLVPAQALFFVPNKPKEELYDTQADPFEIRNLAADPEHAGKLSELRHACDQWLADTQDLGAIPVEEMIRRGIITERDPKYQERRERTKGGAGS